MFIVEIGRRLRHLMSDEGAITMIDLCEQCAEGRITEDELSDLALEHRTDYSGAADNLYWWVADRYKVSSRGVSVALNVFADPGQTALEWGALVRDIYGPNPFLPVSFSPSWRTDTAVSLARTMYESRDFSAMSILADALQDAGCDSADILDHCRNATQPHVRGCWVVDLLLGKS
ncbi:hypothetical protein [Frigoriglobus tundricola]|uniref:hypothetical protein n=1 Tax=Frigoriglobus tundricola TaxID=2774151 RepID=UPI001D072BCE|nr:hypothetical protein [Frigoriglobus tundricola]